MSGHDVEMEYDHEKIYLSSSCHEYDTVEKFEMMIDLALRPKSEFTVNAAKVKSFKNHEAHAEMTKMDPFSDNTEMLIRTAYGESGLGMPLLGHVHNVDNITPDLLQKFMTEKVSAKK